jgi:nucleotide-binding universal stress UspA family protein
MKTHIMVPVNGSREVHSIVPILQSLLDQGGVGKVTLVRVVPLAPAAVLDVPLDYTDIAAADAARREEAEELLREVASGISWRRADHEVVALQGDEADELARFAASGHFDSVLMVSRKRSWFGRLFADNLADRILGAVCLPVTVLPGPECVAHPG